MSKQNPYDYNYLISKPDMTIVEVAGPVPADCNDIVEQAKKNAAKIGQINPQNGTVSVYVKDIDANIGLGRDGLKHGLDRRIDIIGLVTLKAGENIRSSIRINELAPKRDNVDSSYVLIGMARDGNGDLFIVRSVINRYTHKLTSFDVLYAINAKKGNRLRSMRPGFQDPVTDSTISIAELLDYVNAYFPDVLPEDVLKHYGYDRRPAGDLGESALYKLPANANTDRQLLVDAFEQLVSNSEEKEVLQDYKKHMDYLLSLEEKLERLSKELKRLSFAEGPKDVEYINNLRWQRNQTINRINYYDNKLLNLEKAKVLKDLLERKRLQTKQRSYQKAKEYYREKSEKRESEIRQYYRESRRKAVERHNQAQVRQQIRKDVLRLDSLLNHGSKEKNVKLELKEFAGAALRLARGSFLKGYNEYDMIRSGVNATMTRDQKEVLTVIYL